MQFDVDHLTPEVIRDKWSEVNQFERGAVNPESNQHLMSVVMNNLEKKQEAKAAGAASAAPKKASSGLKSEGIFDMMSEYLKQGLGKALIPKVDAVFGFQITTKKGAKPSLVYEIDLKNGQGKC